MKLTDQEQVIVKAIGHGVTEVSRVIKAVGYPKAMTKKVLERLNEKGIVALHRHDYPQSLTPAQRKLMVRIGRDYFNAVSMRKRNPKRKHLAGATAKQQRQYEAIKKSELKRGRKPKTAKRIAAATVRKLAKKRNPSKEEHDFYNKMLAILSRDPHDSHAKGAAQIAGKRLGFTPARIAKDIEKAKGAKRNASRTIHAVSKTHHRGAVAGKTGHKTKRTRSRKNVAAKRKAGASARPRSVVKTRKATTRRLAGNPTRKGMRRGYGRAKSLLKTHGGSEKAMRLAARYMKQKGLKHKSRSKSKNPSAESIRKKFAGRVSGERDVFVPSATPKGGLAKLGNLVLIQTERGTIKPVHGSAVLLADTRGKFHIGSTSGANLFDGPARNFGRVSRIEYEGSKPHLGFKSPIIWNHRLGEESGHRPTLHADGKGGLVFRGGRYRLTARGIED